MNEQLKQFVLQVFNVSTLRHTAHIDSIAEFVPNLAQCVWNNGYNCSFKCLRSCKRLRKILHTDITVIVNS